MISIYGKQYFNVDEMNKARNEGIEQGKKEEREYLLKQWDKWNETCEVIMTFWDWLKKKELAEK